jgi:hypothetical protein
MSEDKKYTLTEYVFRDIRFGNSYPKFANDDEFVQLKELDPITSVKKYHDLVVSKKYNYKPDAERWQRAIESYLEYPCLKDNVEIKQRDKNRFFLNFKGYSVSITADLLTGPTDIIINAETLINDYPDRAADIYSALLSFCSVAYTVGNCCPTMKNPKTTVDTCWWKLYRFHNVDEDHTVPSICDAGWNENLSRRGAQNMFGVFPERLSGRKIVDRLMLKDYYGDGYKLILNATPAQFASKSVDEYINFLRLVTTLIVKRGIRIYYKNKLPEDLDLNETAKNLISGLQKPACN